MIGMILGISAIYIFVGIICIGFGFFDWTIPYLDKKLDEDTQCWSVFLFWPLYLLFTILRLIFRMLVLFFTTIKELFFLIFK